MRQTPTPGSSWKSFSFWLFFAFFAMGPPAALIVVAFTWTLRQNPLLIALFVVGYEVLIGILGFTGKIWQKLEDPLAERLAQWLTLHIGEMTSQYDRRYSQYLVHEHEIFDIKGLSTHPGRDLVL